MMLKKGWLNKLLIFLIILQCGAIIYFNIFEMKYHNGYDASSAYLKAMEIARQNTINISNYYEQTNLLLDTPILLASFFEKFFKNIFLSYGLSNIIHTFISIFLFYKLLTCLKINFQLKLIGIVFFICPYLSIGYNNANDLGYFSMMFSSCAGYSLRVCIELAFLITFICFNDIRHNKKKLLICCFFIEFLLLLCGISSGYYMLLLIIFPCFLSIFFKYFFFIDKIQNQRAIVHKALFCLISGIILILGKLICHFYFKSIPLDDSIRLLSFDKYFENIKGMFLGYFELIAGIPYGIKISVFSFDGIRGLFGYVIAIFCFITFFYSVFILIRNIKNKDYVEHTRLYYIIIVIIINLFAFSILSLTYGAIYFETRYYIPLFILNILIFCYLLNFIKNKKKYHLIIGILLPLIVYITIFSDYKYHTTRNNYDDLLMVANELKKIPSPFVFVSGEKHCLDARNLRVSDPSKIYISDFSNMWGDYSYYRDASDWDGMSILLTDDEDYAKLPKYIQKSYIFYKKISKFNIYLCKENKFDFSTGVSYKRNNNKDFPYTKGIILQNGFLNSHGEYVARGGSSNTYIMFGPYTTISKGRYSFKLNYECLSSNTGECGTFLITLNKGQDVMNSCLLSADNKSSILNVEFKEDSNNLEYVVLLKNSLVKIKSVEISRINN